MGHRFAVPAALTLLFAVLAAPAQAQNVLVNPGFDTSLAGWEVADLFGHPLTVTWDRPDADGSTASGSAKAVWQASSVTGLVAVFSQCVEVNTSAPYVFGGKVFIPGGQTTPGSAFFIALPFPTHGCLGPPPPSAFLATPPVTTQGSWTETTATITPFGPSMLVSAYLAPTAGGTFQASFDDLDLQVIRCAPDDHTICLGGRGRYMVTATFDTGNGSAGRAHAAQAGDSGLLWFFSASNVEVIVKILDGCGVDDHHWFFAGGLTDVAVTITVTDTQTGANKIYLNPRGTPFAPIQDTSAFPCP